MGKAVSAFKKKKRGWGRGKCSDSDILHVHAATFQYETTSEGLVAHAGFAENGKVTDGQVERRRGREMGVNSRKISLYTGNKYRKTHVYKVT